MRISLQVYAVILILALAGCQKPQKATLHVVATTTMVQSVVRDVGGDRVDVGVIIPGASCPGQYDLRPRDLALMRESGLLFMEGFEPIIGRLAKEAKSCPVMVDGPGNPLIPKNYIAACEKASLGLSKNDADGKKYYDARLASITSRVHATERELKDELTKVQGRPVIVSDQQAELARWMGLNVVGVYGRAEEFTPRLLHELAKKNDVVLVIDNLQSGPDAGAELAREIGSKHLTLSNFPGGFPKTDTWDALIRDDVRRVLEALGD